MTARYLINCAILFFVVLDCTIVHASVLQTSVKAFNTEHGLPPGSIRDILPAQDKTVWLASISGLIRFDGSRIQLYTHQPENPHSVPSNDVYSLAQDSKQRIWVAANSQLSYYDRQSDKFFTITPNDKACDIAIKYITLGHNDIVWGISESGILTKYDPQEQLTECFSTAQRLGQQSDTMISSLTYDEQLNAIWLTTEQGLEIFDIPLQKSRLINDFYQTKAFLLSCGFKDSKGNFWAGSFTNGVVKYNVKSQHSVHYSPSQYPMLKGQSLTSIIEADPGELWFAAKDGGVLKMSATGVSQFSGVDVNDNSLQVDYATRFKLDGYGNLWIASSNGIFVLSQSARAVHFTTLDRLNHPDKKPIITALTVDNANLFYLSTTNGIYQLNFADPADKALSRIDRQPLPSSHYSKLYHDSNGLYYICSTAQPYSLDSNRQQFTPLTGQSTLTQCPDFQPSKRDPDKLWIASHNNGLGRLNKLTNTIEALPVFSKRLMALMPEYQDQLWMTSADNGFASLSLKTFQLRTYQHQPGNKNTLPNNLVTDIVKGQGNYLWLATFGGLSRFDMQSETFVNFYREDGLTSEQLSKILTDNENKLWISSLNGLNLFDPETNKITRFHQSNGLPSPKFSLNASTKDKQGNLYYSGPNALYVINPGKLKKANTAFDNFISTIKVDELEIKTLPIPAKVFEQAPRDIEIDYGISAYSAVDSNRFRYYLSGYDPSWRESTKDTSATFSNLPHGTYTFYMQGKTDSGDWITPAATFTFTIPTPLYLSWWAFALYIVLFGLLVKLLGLYLAAAEKEKAQLLQQKVDQQTLSLQQSNEKINNLYQRQQWLFAQLSHEIRTPITLMLAPLAKLQQSNDQTHQNMLSVAWYNQRRLVKMLDQLLDIAQSGNLTPEHKQPVDVQSSLTWIANTIEPLLEQKQQRLIVEIDNPGTVAVSKDALEKILLNLLSNAHKYTDRHGTITLAAKQAQNQCIISVSDTGIGIEADRQESIFECFERGDFSQHQQGVGIGLAVVKQLLAVNNGQIALVSEVGKGSEFTLTFPCVSQETPAHEFSPGHNVTTFAEQLLGDEPVDNQLEQTFEPVDESDHKPTLMLAEDNGQMRQYIIQLLQSDYTIYTAEDGKIALEKAIEIVPDVIISDVMMPQMNGYQLLEQLKKHPVTNHIPVLLLTARDDPASRLKGLTLKADDYIAKPFNPDELRLKIHNVRHLQQMWHLKYQAQSHATIDKPQESAITVQLNEAQQTIVDELEQICLQNYSNPQFKLTDIATQMNLAERQLQRKIKAICGMTPVQILRNVRLAQAKMAIEDGEQITQVAYSCGFSSYDHFSRSFKEKYQMTPRECQDAAKKG